MINFLSEHYQAAKQFAGKRVGFEAYAKGTRENVRWQKKLKDEGKYMPPLFDRSISGEGTVKKVYRGGGNVYYHLADVVDEYGTPLEEQRIARDCLKSWEVVHD